jgi:hypothetical protein
MSFRRTLEAEADVADIYRYSFKNFSETQADAYHGSLSECFAYSPTPPSWAGIIRSFVPVCAAMNMKVIPSITN